MSNFIWVRNPSQINGLSTTYVSKRGSDTTGNGTAQNPYASIAFATSVATTGTNIMLDDGEWSEARTANGRIFHWWSNGNSKIKKTTSDNEFYYFLTVYEHYGYSSFENCYIEIKLYLGSVFGFNAKNCVIYSTANAFGNMYVENCLFKYAGMVTVNSYGSHFFKNCCFIDMLIVSSSNFNCSSCNFTNKTIPTTTVAKLDDCIDDTITNQTFVDYFNNYNANDFTKCDFTAKAGSANIGRGKKGVTIGLNQGYSCKADNTANDIFSTAGGAILHSIEYNTIQGGYILSHKNKVCVGATTNTFVMASDAEAIDDYYNGLFLFITSGDGEGETHFISDYNGATKTATIADTFTVIPTSSVYSVSGKIVSAIKDFGKAIKIKRNWTFQDLPSKENGEWEEFLTHNVSNAMAETSSFQWRYSVDNVLWNEGDKLVSGTDTETKTTSYNIGECSTDYVEASAKNTVCRYVQFTIHIGINN